MSTFLDDRDFLLSETGKVGFSEVFNNKFPNVLSPAPYNKCTVCFQLKKTRYDWEERHYMSANLFFQLRVLQVFFSFLHIIYHVWFKLKNIVDSPNDEKMEVIIK
ncbi:hypothetical protein RIR_jg3839.t1 [Rhizophagus irregularis DAOM 181602=DAOM 197198]|nr:hypothetical protein RIR_jg3839.t1 [Rhizophagus irregularis DAOM 181602=DAOM 197198]